MLFSGARMPVTELAELLPPLGITLPAGSSLQGGTATARLTIEGPVDRLVTAGSVAIEQTRLSGFDLGAKMKAVAALAGIKPAPDTEFQTARLNLRMAPEGMSFEDIQVVAPAVGELSGGGSMAPNQALAFKMRALMHTSGDVMRMLGQKGDTTVPFTIQGTAADPVFRPDVKAVASDKIQQLEPKAMQKAAGSLLQGIFGTKQGK
jgi:AsmA protein